MSNLKKTSLHQKHLDLQAKMVDFGGWEMPIQYKNLKEEVVAVRENAGVFDVSHMGEFYITGKDALNFIDYAVTNDIKAANNGKAVYSPLCDSNGKIIDDLIVYKISEQEIFVCVNAANIDKDFQALESIKAKFDCELKNLSADYSLLALQGPKSFELLKSIVDEVQDIEYYSIQLLETIKDQKSFIARTGYTGEDGFEIFGSHEFIANLWGKLIDAGVEPCGLGSRDVLRLEVCFPLYGNELNQDITPLDAGLKWTVKMNKEDFVGKSALESYAAKYQLVKLSLDKGIPRAGYEVENEKGESIGVITSGTQSVVLKKGIALARVDKNLYQDSEKLNINIRGKLYPAEINKKPFVTGGHK
ncbi:MAG: glycine cleavage system aminomethyltransferase GcvT [Bdellovibrionota bacterium]|nr:glycine cleavage system aminomethyltransferase GcvT [Bdellovibrionota bacterium]